MSISINNVVNIDVDRHWGYSAQTATVGVIVSTLPASCITIIVDGVFYQNCGGTYAPRYDSLNIVYEVALPLSGLEPEDLIGRIKSSLFPFFRRFSSCP